MNRPEQSPEPFAMYNPENAVLPNEYVKKTCAYSYGRAALVWIVESMGFRGLSWPVHFYIVYIMKACAYLVFDVGMSNIAIVRHPYIEYFIPSSQQCVHVHAP